jgi:hypothetical protein
MATQHTTKTLNRLNKKTIVEAHLQLQEEFDSMQAGAQSIIDAKEEQVAQLSMLVDHRTEGRYIPTLLRPRGEEVARIALDYVEGEGENLVPRHRFIAMKAQDGTWSFSEVWATTATIDKLNAISDAGGVVSEQSPFFYKEIPARGDNTAYLLRQLAEQKNMGFLAHIGAAVDALFHGRFV